MFNIIYNVYLHVYINLRLFVFSDKILGYPRNSRQHRSTSFSWFFKAGKLLCVLFKQITGPRHH